MNRASRWNVAGVALQLRAFPPFAASR